MSTTHRAIATTAKGVVSEITVPTPQPGAEEVLIQVGYTVIIAPDTYASDWGWFVSDYPAVFGYSIAGVVKAVGQGVKHVAVGDQVIGYAIPQYGLKAKGSQHYSVLPHHAVGKVPSNLSLSDAVTLPDNFVTAYWTLKTSLSLPLTWDGAKLTLPASFAGASFFIYGAGSTAGQYIIQILKSVGAKNVIASASPKHHAYLKSIGAAHVVDYRDPDSVTKILGYAGGPVKFAVDPIATEASLKTVAGVVDGGSKVAVLIPIKTGTESIIGNAGASIHFEIPEGKSPFKDDVEVVYTRTFTYIDDVEVRDTVMSQILPTLVASGTIQPSRKVVIDDSKLSLKERVNQGLDLYRQDKVSGEKVVVKIQDV